MANSKSNNTSHCQDFIEAAVEVFLETVQGNQWSEEFTTMIEDQCRDDFESEVVDQVLMDTIERTRKKYKAV